MYHEANLQAFFKIQMTGNQPKTRKQRGLLRTVQHYVGRTATQVNTTGTRPDLFTTSWSTTHLVSDSYRPAAVLTGTINNHVQSIKNGTW